MEKTVFFLLTLMLSLSIGTAGAFTVGEHCTHDTVSKTNDICDNINTVCSENYTDENNDEVCDNQTANRGGSQHRGGNRDGNGHRGYGNGRI